LSKQRINDLHEALDKYTLREGALIPPSMQTPEERAARIRELGTRHLASMASDDFDSMMAEVKALRDGGAAAAADNEQKKREAAARAEAATKAGQDAPSFQ